MLKTFNCGVGFCLIVNKKNLNKIKKYFPKDFKPYEIGIIKNNKTYLEKIVTVVCEELVKNNHDGRLQATRKTHL